MVQNYTNKFNLKIILYSRPNIYHTANTIITHVPFPVVIKMPPPRQINDPTRATRTARESNDARGY